jgi:threonyl-tRNA synthetase
MMARNLWQKIRLAEKMKVPYILVVGEKEEQAIRLVSAAAVRVIWALCQ